MAIPVQLAGTYKISGAIQPYAFRASGNLHILVYGHVRIVVDPASAAFGDVLYFHTTESVNNCTISGGTLSIDGADKAGRGISIRHDASAGGEVIISARLSIVNIKETTSTTRENQALAIYGQYINVLIEQPYVKNVSRTIAGSATKGIAVASLFGTCTINQAYVESITTDNALAPTAADADGIAVFGKQLGSGQNAKQGRANINECTFVNCQGRSFKGQSPDCVVYRPRVQRTNAVVASQHSCDFDFQESGSALLFEPHFVYKDNPFSISGSSFSAVVFQQTIDNVSMDAKCVGGVMYTQTSIPRFCSVISNAAANTSVAEVNGLRVVPIGNFSGSAFVRAVIETDMATVALKTNRTRLVVKNVEAPMSGVNMIGYTGYVGGDLSAKLSWEVAGNASSIVNPTASNRVFRPVSGATVGAVDAFNVSSNSWISNRLDAGVSFDFLKLRAGCTFTVDITTTGTIANAPPWAGFGYASIEVLGSWDTNNYLNIRVICDQGNTAAKRLYTRDGGASWFTQ